MLLLARNANLWWRTLSAAYPEQGHLVDALTVPGNVIELSARIEERAPGQIVAGAVAAFAEHLRLPVPPLPQCHGDPDTPILRLHAEALVAVLSGGHRSGSADVLAEVLAHEARYWRSVARRAGLPAGEEPDSDIALRQLAGQAALLGASGDDQVADLVSRAPSLAGIDRRLTRRYAGWLTSLYPAEAAGGDLGAVHPDLLAESLAVQVLHEQPPDRRTALFQGLSAAQAAQALTTLGRASAHQQIGRAHV